MTVRSAFLGIDLLNCFMPYGSLPVEGGTEIIIPINDRMREYDDRILVRDMHDPKHSYFASQHPGKKPGDEIDMPYGKQRLWPDHGVPGTDGGDFHPAVETEIATLILGKGMHRQIDSYSGFFENDKITPTGLHGYLWERKVARLRLGGVATNICVKATALDGVRLGYEVEVEVALCRGIEIEGNTVQQAIEEMRAAGVRII